MNILNRVASLLISVALVFAGPTGRSQGVIAGPPSISGQVVNSLTGEPIARALVQVGDARSALTDHQGRFAFDHAGNDSSAVFTSKPGYFPSNNAVFVSGGPITLQLIPEAILSGTITGQNGEPVQDLPIQLKMLQVRGGLRHWDQMQATTTNAEGEFRFAELQAGKYRVSTGFQVQGMPDVSSSLAFVPVVYPPPAGDGVSDALTLRPGDRVQANLSPPAEKLYPVSGTINGLAGQGAGFEITTQDGEAVSPALHVSPTGAFLGRFPSGAYHLKVSSFGQNEQLMGTRDIQVGHTALEGVSLSVAPQPNLPVEVEYQAVATASQHDQPDAPPNLNLSLEQAGSAGPVRAFNAEPVPPTNGTELPRTMVIKDVESGRYELRAQINQPWYLASATCGNLDLLRDQLVIAADAGGCTIRAVMRNDIASLQWSMAPGDKVTGTENARPALVVAIPLDNLTRLVEAANVYGVNAAPMTGTFQALAPGRYLIMALEHPQELPYREPGAMERYLSLGQEVTLLPNDHAEVDLHLVAGEP